MTIQRTHSGFTALAFASICALASTSVSDAAIIYVDSGAATGGDGASWNTAFKRVRTALLAAHDGDEIRVAQGTYCPTRPLVVPIDSQDEGDASPPFPGDNRGSTFLIPHGVSLVGGFAGAGAPDPDEYDPENNLTILTGDVNGDDGPDFANYADNLRHVVKIIGGGRQTILRGVTVSGGNASGAQAVGDDLSGVGAGILVMDESSPSILECVIELNQAVRGGAGIHAPRGKALLRRCIVQNNQSTGADAFGGACVLTDGSRVERCEFLGNTSARSGGAIIGDGIDVTNSDFEDNSATEFGGAVAGNGLTFTDCTFTGNSAKHGGAIRGANITLTNCTFEDNSAERRGGAILAAARLTLKACTFAMNEGESGGAVDVRGDLQADKCLFDRNSTGTHGLDGGALAIRGLADLVNCEFLANFAGREGGAISLDEGAAAAVNCLLAGNRARRVGGAIINDHARFDLVNCALTGNRCDLIPGHVGNVAFTRDGGALHNRHGGELKVLNCILWDNDADGSHDQDAQLFHEDGTLIVAHSLVQGWDGSHGGVGNAGDDPLLGDADGPDNIFGTIDDDVTLLGGSPARDVGDASLLPRDALDVDADGRTNERTPLDLLGHRRVRGGAVDIGPIESGGAT